jgi:hypothetical protein
MKPNFGTKYRKSHIYLFFFISTKISLKKRKAPLSTQEVYTGATQLDHMKNSRKPIRNYIPTTPKTHMKPKIQEKPQKFTYLSTSTCTKSCLHQILPFLSSCKWKSLILSTRISCKQPTISTAQGTEEHTS